MLSGLPYICDPGFESFNKIARLSRPILVTEKIDGSNAQVCIVRVDPTASLNQVIAMREVDGHHYAIYAGSRSRWVTPGKSTDNYGFAGWVSENADELTKLGEGRHYGEWWGKGINRGYGLDHKRFSLFNVSRWTPETTPACCCVVPTLYQGEFDMSVIDQCLLDLESYGSCAAPGFRDPEGIVIFHSAGGILFKKTIIGDEAPKSVLEKAA